MVTTYSTRFSCSSDNKQLTDLDLEMTSILELSKDAKYVKYLNKDIKCVKESSATDGQHAWTDGEFWQRDRKYKKNQMAMPVIKKKKNILSEKNSFSELISKLATSE